MMMSRFRRRVAAWLVVTMTSSSCAMMEWSNRSRVVVNVNSDVPPDQVTFVTESGRPIATKPGTNGRYEGQVPNDAVGQTVFAEIRGDDGVVWKKVSINRFLNTGIFTDLFWLGIGVLGMAFPKYRPASLADLDKAMVAAGTGVAGLTGSIMIFDVLAWLISPIVYQPTYVKVSRGEVDAAIAAARPTPPPPPVREIPDHQTGGSLAAVVNITENASIQEGIDLAQAGDTVLVHGEHREQVTVNKPITLKGAEDSVLRPPSDDFSDAVVLVEQSEGITLDGLHVELPLVDDPIKTDGVRGIVIQGQAKARLVDCTIDGGDIGVLLLEQGHAMIESSRITRCGSGLALTGQAKATMGKSEVSESTLNGIEAVGDSTLFLIGNDINENKASGVFAGERAQGAVAANTLRTNGDAGIRADDNSHLRIAGNMIQDNQHCGVVLTGSASGDVKFNRIRGNGAAGIACADAAASISVFRNTIVANGGDGILVIRGSQPVIETNVIYNNAWAGISSVSPEDPPGYPETHNNLLGKHPKGNLEGVPFGKGDIVVRDPSFLADDVLMGADGQPDNRFGWSGPEPDDVIAASIKAAALPTAVRPKVPPSLSARLSFTDATGNQALDAEETAVLTLDIANNGKGAATDVRATLSLAAPVPGMAIPGSIYVGTLAPGENRQVKIQIQADRSLVDRQAALVTAINDAFGYDAPIVQTTFETRSYRAPVLVVKDIGADDGNGDGVLSRGEQVDIKVIVANNGGTAHDVKAELLIGHPGIVLNGSSVAQLGELPAGQWKQAEFSMFVKNTYDGPAELPLSIRFSEAHPDITADGPLRVVLNQTGPRIIEQTVLAKGDVPSTSLPVPELGIDVDEVPAGAITNPDAVAVVFGVERYNERVPAVTYAKRDAAVMREYLTRTLGLPPENVVLLTDEQVTLANLKTYLEGRLGRQIEPGKSDVFVYFAGHGTPDLKSQQPFLVPFDGDPQYPETSCYPLASAYETLGRLGARSVTVVLDACFSGASGRTETVQTLLAGARPSFIETRGPAVPAGVTVFAAAADKQISSGFDRKKHGLFTYYFLKGLRGDADANQDKLITVGEMESYLQGTVPKEARRMSRDQDPVVVGDKTRVLLRR